MYIRVDIQNILGQEGDLILEIVEHDMRYALGAVGKFPMSSHDINA